MTVRRKLHHEKSRFFIGVSKEPVLKGTLTVIHHLKEHSHEQCYRYAYKQYSWWVYGRMSRGNRKVLPFCVVRAIRKRFPGKNADHVPFLEFVEST